MLYLDIYLYFSQLLLINLFLEIRDGEGGEKLVNGRESALL